jgi:hypothetical protein
MHHSRTLTLEQINEKIDALAAKVERGGPGSAISLTWWHDHAGRFENDPVFDEIVRLGREARKSQRANLKKKRARS